MHDRANEWRAAIEAAADEAELRATDQRLFGKNGELQELLRSVSSLPKEQRPDAGRSANLLKAELRELLDGRRTALAATALQRELQTSTFDPTEPGPRLPAGTLHPITVVQNELVDLFASLGFSWQDGPEIESEFYNYDALNIPGDHPARDAQDTFWLTDGTLLRTHTSPVQIRTMQRFPPPLKVIAPGRCFRQETVDASHEHTFYQMEGLVVDRNVSTANLIHTMKTCLREILQRDVAVRLRPGFFPFVEPGFELDVNCPFCAGSGCKVCKQSGWIEILPCGMVHPNVLAAGGIDPEEFTGFAFGMGLQRVVMLRYGIDDIRLFMGGDLRFLEQFEEIGSVKISRRWLSRYVDLSDQTAEQIRDNLTMSTAEIEGVESFGGGLEPIVVGHVVDSARHPDADKLTVNRVDVGGDAPLQIICGAPNIAAGIKVPVVQPGATLPGGLKIKKSKIRGVESFGMICSERELGLSEEHDGIMVLGQELAPGAAFVDVVPVLDDVFEIDNKSVNHRPDLWGHVGFARELAAILGRPLAPVSVAHDLPSEGVTIPVEIDAQVGCARFTTVVIDGVDTRRSPDWLRWLLHAVGQRPINSLVDLTNFVMLDVGQPLHAFDLREIDAERGIRVRSARAGEVLRTIDEVDRQLVDGDILVTSGDRPVALAGVMGGAGSAVRDDTQRLVLESANFAASRIRRTSTRLGLRTDASARFEKALDPAAAELGSRRFVQLVREFWPGADARGPLVDPNGFEFVPPRVALRRQRLRAKLGVTVADDQVETILRGLQFGVTAQGDGWAVEVPSFRATKDIAIEDDLIEEVGRMFRYDNIPEQPLVSTVAVPERVPVLYLGRELLRVAATEMAFHEVYNYSFVADAVLAAVGADDHSYARIANPVAPEQTRMRRHVLPSVLSGVAGNLRTRTDVRLMELGKGYHPEHRDEHGLPRQVHELAFAWGVAESAEAPYAILRSQLERLLRRCGYPVEFGAAAEPAGMHPWCHPGKTAPLLRGGTQVGYVGHAHPGVARALDLPTDTAIASVDLAALIAAGRDLVQYRSIPRFPSQPVDVALLVPTETRVADVAAFLTQTGKKLVRKVELFEVYRGPGLPAGTKSLNFTVTLGADQRTLDTKDEERFLARVRERASDVGAELRG